MEDLSPPPLPDTARRLAAMAKVRVVTVGNRRMVFRVWGAGPPVILFHGGHGCWLHWLRNIPALAANYEVYVPDLPGFGDSDLPPEDRFPSALALTQAAIETLDPGPEFYVAGFSYGAQIAGGLAPLLRNRLRRVLLIGSVAFAQVSSVAMPLQRWRPLPSQPARDAAHRHNLAAIMFGEAERINSEAVEVQAYSAARTRIGHRSSANDRAFADALGRSGVPVSGLWGTRDALCLGKLREIERRFETTTGGSFTTVPRAGHWVQFEAARAANRWLVEQLRNG